MASIVDEISVEDINPDAGLRPEIEKSDRYRKMFDESREALQGTRLNAELCRDYFDDKQLSRKAKALLRRRGQPEVIRNRIKPAVNGILGILQQAKVDPRGLPRNPDDENAADVCSKTLRYIADVNRFHVKKVDAADNHIVEGIAAFIVEASGAGDKAKVPITQIPYSEFFYDPRSREADYSDARYMGIAKWVYADDLARMYPDYEPEIEAAAAGVWSTQFGAPDNTWDDKPDNVLPWIDKRNRRLMVVEMYHRDTQWMRCVFFAGGVLEKAVSAYLDDDDQPMNPIEASSCFIDRENRRYGVVQSMLFMQDEINARASRALHLTNSRQLQAADPNNPPTTSADEARAEAARADGVIPTGWQTTSTTDMAAGNLALLSDAKAEIDRMAPTPAVLGQSAGADSSGRSKQVTQQAGMTELARPLGRFEDLENRVYRQAWLRARQFWTAPMWVRVTDDEGVAEFLQINKPVMGQVPQPVVDPATGQPAIDPMTGQPVIRMTEGQVGTENEIAKMGMDIEVDTVPDTANLNAETFAALLPLAPQMMQAYGPKATFDVLFKLSPFPNKAEVRAKLDEGAKEVQAQQAQQAQMQQQMAQQAAQLAAGKAQADIRNTDAKTQSEEADAVHTRAETARIAMENAVQFGGAAMPPPQPQQPPPAPEMQGMA